MVKFLDQDKVTEYAQLSAKIDELEERRKDLRPELIDQLEDGYKCPKDGPYLLKLTYQNRRSISWKDEFAKIAREFLGKAWLKRRNGIVDSAPKTKIPMLLPKTNPRYKVEGSVTPITRGRGVA